MVKDTLQSFKGSTSLIAGVGKARRACRDASVAAVLTLVLAMTACGPPPWRETYLYGAVDKATQEEAVKRFGPPTSTEDLRDGRSVWQYHYPRASLLNEPGAEQCLDFILTFDEQHVLRNWRKQGC